MLAIIGEISDEKSPVLGKGTVSGPFGALADWLEGNDNKPTAAAQAPATDQNTNETQKNTEALKENTEAVKQEKDKGFFQGIADWLTNHTFGMSQTQAEHEQAGEGAGGGSGGGGSSAPAEGGGIGGMIRRGAHWLTGHVGGWGSGTGPNPDSVTMPETPGKPGQYRKPYKLSSDDLSDDVVNTIAGEAQHNQKSIDAVIDNMLNRVGTKTYGPSGNLREVARAPGQYAGYRHASAQEAQMIRERIKAISSGAVPDITGGSNEYRAGWYRGPWGQKHASSPVIGGNRFAFNPKGGVGPYGPIDPHKAIENNAAFSINLRDGKHPLGHTISNTTNDNSRKQQVQFGPNTTHVHMAPGGHQPAASSIAVAVEQGLRKHINSVSDNIAPMSN